MTEKKQQDGASQTADNSAEIKGAAKPNTQPAKEKTAGKKENNETEKRKGGQPAKPVKNELPEIRPGMTIRIHQKIKEINPKGEEKERVQVFEGIVLARKHGKTTGATITVRKISDGIGVEKIYPLHSPLITKIEVVKKSRVKRAKLYYLRNYKKRLKEKKA